MNEMIENIVSDMSEDIKIVDDDLMVNVAGVAQALGQLRKALDKVDECLDQRQFSKASSLGYKGVSSEYIFLQRVLGGLQDSQNHKQKLVQDVALKAKVSYEEAAPFLEKHMDSLNPKKV